MKAERLFVGARLAFGAAAAGVDAFAVNGGRFVAVGSRAVLDALRDRATDVLDLGGRIVIPGLHDAHTHLAGGALELAGVDLRGCGSATVVASRVLESARKAPPGSWIRGFGWDVASWPPQECEWPRMLAAAAPDHPTFLSRADGHAAWLNATALRVLRTTGEALGPTVPGDGGSVVEERAAEALRRRLPLPAGEELRISLERALRAAADAGLTTIQDVVEPWALPVYAALREERRLPLRVALWLPLEADEEEAREWRRRFPPDDPWLAVTTRKVFLDGTLCARSAALEEPYFDDTGRRGELLVDPAGLLDAVRAADAGGWAVAFHAVGDRAVRAALDTLEVLAPCPRSRPHRIEHAQVVRRIDFGRFHALRAAVSLQPLHWLDDRPWVASRVGERAGSVLYPWRSLRACASAGFAFGTDWPVAALDPERTLDAVRLRASCGGADAEAVSIFEAVVAYTEGAATASGLAADRGRIAPGQRADFLVLDTARTDGEPAEGVLPALRPHRRFVGGVESTV